MITLYWIVTLITFFFFRILSIFNTHGKSRIFFLKKLTVMCIHKGLNFWIHSIDPNNPIAKVNHKANYGSKSNNLLIVAKKGQVFFFFF